MFCLTCRSNCSTPSALLLVLVSVGILCLAVQALWLERSYYIASLKRAPETFHNTSSSSPLDAGFLADQKSRTLVDPISKLLDWFQAGGGLLRSFKVVGDGAGGHKCIASADISVGEVVLRVPLSLIITQDVYSPNAPRTPTHGLHQKPARKMSVAGDVALKLFVATRAGSDHVAAARFAPFFGSVPAEAAPSWSGMPLFWSTSQLDCFKGSRAFHVMDFQRAQTAKEFGLTSLSGISKETFRWASGVVASRAFNIGNKRGQTHSVLIPVADLINTAQDPHLYWTLNSSVGTVDFVAARSVARGVELTNSYGKHPNVKMLLTYGFTFPEMAISDFSNQGLFAYSLELTLAEVESAAADRGVLIHLADKVQFMPRGLIVFRFARAVDAMALQSLHEHVRFLTLPKGPKSIFSSARCSKNALPAPRCRASLDADHELMSLQLLASLLRNKLRRYPSELRDDEAELKSSEALPPWRMSCLRVLRDEKRPLALSLDIVTRELEAVISGRAGKGPISASPGQEDRNVRAIEAADKLCQQRFGGPLAGAAYWRCEADRVLEEYLNASLSVSALDM